MSTAAEAKLEYEAGQTLAAYAAMTDAGAGTVHYLSASTIWSGKSGYTPSILPNGMVSGRNVIGTSATNDTVSIAAFTAYSKGALQTVSATSATFTRPGTATKAKIYSVTMASDGSIAVVAGTISASLTFSETRAAAGGPPYIPDESVELGQIRVTSSTAAVVASSEIYQTPGTHTERYDTPVWTENNIGDGDQADTSKQENAYIKFASALPSIHTGGTRKHVYARVYVPTFSEIPRSKDFVPAENTHSVNSEQIYQGTVASKTSTLGQGSFTAYGSDGVTDGLVRVQDEIITFRFYPDKDESPYVLMQGTLGIGRTFPPSNQIGLACTISAETKSANFTS